MREDREARAHGGDEPACVGQRQVDLVPRLAVDHVQDEDVGAEGRLELGEVSGARDQAEGEAAADEAEAVGLHRVLEPEGSLENRTAVAADRMAATSGE